MGALFSTVIGSALAFFATDVARRGLRLVSFFGGVLALTAGLVVAIEAVADSLLMELPADVQALATAVLPRNLHVCIGIAFGARVTRWVYDWNVRFLDKATA